MDGDTESMIKAPLNEDQIRLLDQTRQLLISLNTSLSTLRTQLYSRPSLPPWPNLQHHASLISNNLKSVKDKIEWNRDTFQSTVVNPLPQFPGREHQMILETLLRTRLEPASEDWISEGQSIITEREQGSYWGLSDQDRRDLWAWAPLAANELVKKEFWDADYTREEIESGVENVKHGLKRELKMPSITAQEGEESEYEEVTDDEGEDDKMDVEKADAETKPPPGPGMSGERSPSLREQQAQQLSLSSIHKFMSTGR